MSGYPGGPPPPHGGYGGGHPGHHPAHHGQPHHPVLPPPPGYHPHAAQQQQHNPYQPYPHAAGPAAPPSAPAGLSQVPKVPGVPGSTAGKATTANGKAKANRVAAGGKWHDPSLDEWDPNDFRIFVGDLGNEVSDEGLARAFQQYQSLVKAKVVRDKKSAKGRGYGFVSFKDPADYTKAMKEMHGKYIGNRPVKLRKSTWKDRDVGAVKKKEKKRGGVPENKKMTSTRFKVQFS